jgi:hypothetical protein
VPVLPAPVASADFSSGFTSFKPLPVPVPWPMLDPPPEPPRPGCSPPDGERASEPLPPVPGMPTLEPGCGDTTIPARLLLPSEPLGGARTEPASPGPPKPIPFLPEPEGSEAVPTEGGGGTTLLASVAPLPEPEFRVPPEDELLTETDGGGGITFDAPREELSERAGEPASPTDGGGGTTFALSALWRVPDEDADEPEFPADGGGGITLAARVLDPELRVVPAEFPAATVGGGGTTSWVPKSLPMMLLTSDPFAD